MELWRPDCPFKLFQVNRFKNPAPGKGKGKAPAIEATPEIENSSVDASSAGQAGSPGTSTPPPAGRSEASSSSQPNSRSSTPSKSKPVFGPPLDLGVKSMRAYKVHETLRLFGSGVSLSDEEHNAMLNDQGVLSADVGRH